MATFNQQGQSVNTQYNAENIHFESCKTPVEFIESLKQLQLEFSRSLQSKDNLDENDIDAESFLKKAVSQASKPHPDKKSLVKNLTSAKELATNVNELVSAISKAITTVGALF
jgi:hypothetical protein